MFRKLRRVRQGYSGSRSVLSSDPKLVFKHLRSQTLPAGTHRRTIANIPAVLLPPVVFGGLVITLWTWKCLMMVIFQNKIIYMPGLPPNARRETIADYRNQCGGIEWREERTTSSDGTQISLCVASVKTGLNPTRVVYILYFQGNASSLPPRLPLLSPVLRMLRDSLESPPIQYKLVACSYRGYWTSRGRPTEQGIIKDAEAALQWINDDSRKSSLANAGNITVVVWGQSIGAGFATQLAAISSKQPDVPTISALILETPFLSIKTMLDTLYPQKWLPYRYLWPLLRNHLDNVKALGEILESRRKNMQTLILDAGKDELVPRSHGDLLEERCRTLGFRTTRHTVGGALHTEAILRPDGRIAVVKAIRAAGRS